MVQSYNLRRRKMCFYDLCLIFILQRRGCDKSDRRAYVKRIRLSFGRCRSAFFLGASSAPMTLSNAMYDGYAHYETNRQCQQDNQNDYYHMIFLNDDGTVDRCTWREDDSYTVCTSNVLSSCVRRCTFNDGDPLGKICTRRNRAGHIQWNASRVGCIG